MGRDSDIKYLAGGGSPHAPKRRNEKNDSPPSPSSPVAFCSITFDSRPVAGLRPFHMVILYTYSSSKKIEK